MNHFKSSYCQLINRSNYDYFLSLDLKDSKNFNTTKQLKIFLKHLHKKLFSSKYIKQNKFLQLCIVQEKLFSDSNAHFHILISTNPHNFTFDDLTKAFKNAENKCSAIRNIKNKETERLTTNFYKNPEKKKLYSNPFFPYNLVPIDSPKDQHKIVSYLVKKCNPNSSTIAIIMPERKDYFNFSFDPSPMLLNAPVINFYEKSIPEVTEYIKIKSEAITEDHDEFKTYRKYCEDNNVEFDDNIKYFWKPDIEETAYFTEFI